MLVIFHGFVTRKSALALSNLQPNLGYCYVMIIRESCGLVVMRRRKYHMNKEHCNWWGQPKNYQYKYFSIILLLPLLSIFFLFLLLLLDPFLLCSFLFFPLLFSPFFLLQYLVHWESARKVYQSLFVCGFFAAAIRDKICGSYQYLSTSSSSNFFSPPYFSSSFLFLIC